MVIASLSIPDHPRIVILGSILIPVLMAQSHKKKKYNNQVEQNQACKLLDRESNKTLHKLWREKWKIKWDKIEKKRKEKPKNNIYVGMENIEKEQREQSYIMSQSRNQPFIHPLTLLLFLLSTNSPAALKKTHTKKHTLSSFISSSFSSITYLLTKQQPKKNSQVSYWNTT